MEGKILNLFLYSHKLKFNQIEKGVGERSNKVSYYLTKLVDKNILVKSGENYELTGVAEKMIPYLSSKKSVLPVILIHLGDKDRCFLIKRKKRPFKEMLGLPGGRLLVGESIEEGAKRIMGDKFGVNVSFRKVCSVGLENVFDKGKLVHSFLLIFVRAKLVSGELCLLDVKEVKKEVIESDYKLITNDLSKKVNISDLVSRPDR